MMGIEGLIGKVNLQLKSSESSENTECSVSDELPRLSIFNNMIRGPALTPEQEADLLEHLSHVLKQVQTSVKSLDLQPVELDSIQITLEDPVSADHRKTYPSSVRDVLSALKKRSESPDNLYQSYLPPSKYRPSQQLTSELSKEDQEKMELVQAIHNLSFAMKRTVSVFLQNSSISFETALKLFRYVDCVDQNLELLILKKGHCLSLAWMVHKFLPDSINSIFGEIKFYTDGVQKLVTVMESILDNVGTCPGAFHNIGKEAEKLITQDFCFQNHKIKVGGHDNLTAAYGGQLSPGETNKIFTVKIKQHNQTFSITAGNENTEVCSTKLTLDKINGHDMKCVVDIPFPASSAKVQLVKKMNYKAFSGDFMLKRSSAGADGDLYYPIVNLSALWGVRSVGLGGQLGFDSEEKKLIHSVGINFRSDLESLGFTLKQGRTFSFSLCKKIIDSPTTVAAVAKYSRDAGVDGGLKCTFAIKHCVDPDLYMKARVGTEGIGVAVKQCCLGGKFTVKAAAHLDYIQWRRPKIGVEFSYQF